MITKLFNIHFFHHSVDAIRRKIAYRILPKNIRSVFNNIDDLLKEVASSTKQANTYHFATRVAHDIRSPLAVLNSVVEQYKQSGKLDIETVTLVCRRISKIANDLMIRENSHDPYQSMILPYLVLSEVVNEKQYLAKKINCQLSFSYSEEVKNIFCQASHLELSRVLSNLINNAMEAIQESGNIHIELFAETEAIILSVKDNGVGIPESVKQNILSGQTITTKARGAGIGLRSAIDYIQSLSGEFLIDSQLGRGTTVMIRLPSCHAPLWFVKTLVLNEQDGVLVVDDEAQVYEYWQKKLKTVAVNMHYISGGEKSVKAFDYIRESRYDLYLLDYQNPHLIKDGVDMIEEYGLKEKAILVTAQYDDVLLQQICNRANIKMLPKGFISDITVVSLNKRADVYLIDDDALFAKSFCRYVALQEKTMHIFSDLFNIIRCLPLLNKSAKFYVDLTIETERDGLQVVDLLSRAGIKAIYILSGENGLNHNEVSNVVKAVYNKAEFDWSMVL